MRHLRLVALDMLLHLPSSFGCVLRLLHARQAAEEEAHREDKRLVDEARDERLHRVEGGAAQDKFADLVENERDEEKEAQ